MNEAHTIAALSERLARRERELRAVHRISAALHAETGLDDFIQQALFAAIDCLEASAGAVLLHDPESNRLVFRYVHGPTCEVARELTGRSIDPRTGLAGHVFQTGNGLVTQDADGDPRHSDEIDVVTHYETRDMVTAPLKSTQGRCIGVIQVLNRREGHFDDRDLKMLEILAGEAASCIETSRLQSTILDWETDKRRFACEVLRCVTEDKLRLVDHEDIPDEGRLLTATCLTNPGGYARMRECIAEAAAEAGMDPDVTADLTLAAGEAASNTIKHGIEGCAEVRRTADRIIIDVRDRGPGIRPRDLPRVLFQAGFSTKISLGMGYTLMLELADRIWLATSQEGTRIRLEKLIHPAPLNHQPLREVLERFATV